MLQSRYCGVMRACRDRERCTHDAALAGGEDGAVIAQPPMYCNQASQRETLAATSADKPTTPSTLAQPGVALTTCELAIQRASSSRQGSTIAAISNACQARHVSPPIT